MLSYKSQSAGRKLIKIDPRNTTQRCSACRSIVKKDLSIRVDECPYCDFSCNRDYNASRNILITGMEQPAAPIESKPLHHIIVMPGLGNEVGSRAQQGTVVHEAMSFGSVLLLTDNYIQQLRTKPQRHEGTKDAQKDS